MTYYVKTDDQEVTNALKLELDNRGFKEGKLPVDFVFLTDKASFYRNRIDMKKSKLTNIIYYPDITDKAFLCEKFKGESFIKDSVTIEDKIPELSRKFLKILKPVDGFAGSDIHVVQTREEIEEWMNKHKHPKWVLQDYVKDPALKTGHKFHLRVYILVIGKKVFLCQKASYCPAKKPYEKDNWNDKDIHDTHPSTKEYYYPDSLPDGWKRKKDLTEVFQTVFKGIQLKPDWNSGHSYYIFGADVMFEKRKPILLEVNSRVSFSYMSKVWLFPELLNVISGKSSLFEQIL